MDFKVDRQRLSKQPGCDFSNIVAKSTGYLRAKFHFNQNDWDGCKKAASFWVGSNEYPVLLDDNDSCVIPSEALIGDHFEVSVTGAKRDGYRISTNKFKIRQEVC